MNLFACRQLQTENQNLATKLENGEEESQESRGRQSHDSKTFTSTIAFVAKQNDTRENNIIR